MSLAFELFTYPQTVSLELLNWDFWTICWCAIFVIWVNWSMAIIYSGCMGCLLILALRWRA